MLPWQDAPLQLGLIFPLRVAIFVPASLGASQNVAFLAAHNTLNRNGVQLQPPGIGHGWIKSPRQLEPNVCICCSS